MTLRCHTVSSLTSFVYSALELVWHSLTTSRNGVVRQRAYRPYSDDVTYLISDVAAILSGRNGSRDCVRIAWCYGKDLRRC